MAKRLGQHQAPSSAWIKPLRRTAIAVVRDRLTCVWQATPACAARHGSLRDAKPADVTLDHLVSKAEYAALSEETQKAFGSVHATHNLVTACRSCNSARQDKPWTAFGDADAHARILVAKDVPLNTELARAILAGTAPDPRTEARAY